MRTALARRCGCRRTASAEDLRAVWGPVVAEAGSYEVSGGEFRHASGRVEESRRHESGLSRRTRYRIVGDTLWLTPQRNARGAVKNPPTIKLVRVE